MRSWDDLTEDSPNSNVCIKAFTTAPALPTVATPTFSPDAGIYTSAQTVTISCATTGATIHYTTTGIDPTENDPVIASGSTVAVPASLTLKAAAWETNWSPSAVKKAAYVITGTVATPTFSPDAGIYTSAQTVTVRCGAAGATIHYTINGNDPTQNDPVIASGSTVAVSAPLTLKAAAWETNWLPSGVKSAIYNISEANPSPLIGIGNLNNGDLKSGIFTIIGVILDGSLVSQVAVQVGDGPWETAMGVDNWSYTVNSRQIVLNSSYSFDSATGNLAHTYQRGPYYGNLNITIRAFDANDSKLDEKTVTVTIIPEAPAADLGSGTFGSPLNVVLKAAPEVSIYYTTDGSNPQINGVPYTGSSPIPVSQSTTINAVAESNNNLYSTVYTLNLQITSGTAPPTCNIQYYQDLNLTQPLPDPPYLTTGTYYLKLVTTNKLSINPTLTINAPGTLNNVTQAAVVQLSDCVYRYTRVINNDNAATGIQQETVQLSGADIYGNNFVNLTPVNSITNAAYPDTQPPAAGSIALASGGSTTNDPAPYFEINSNGADQMRLALSEAGLATALWVNYTPSYDGFDVSNGGNGTKTIWIEFKDQAGNIQTQPASTTINYLNSPLAFNIAYYSDLALTQSLGDNPVLGAGDYYLKITANQDLFANPTVNIVAEGTGNNVTNGATIKLTSKVYYYLQTVVADPAAIGAIPEQITVNGITPSNADAASAYTKTTQSALTVNNVGNGGATSSAVETVNSGANPNTTATPKTGYQFINWPPTGGAGTTTFGNADSVNSAAIQDALTIINDDHGGVTPSGTQTVNDGTGAIITAIPNAGYQFVNWTQTGGTGTAAFDNANSASATVSVTGGDVTIKANFAIIQYTLTVNNNGNGGAAPSGIQTVNYGTCTNITAIPNAGYQFVNWIQTGGTGTAAFGNANAASTSVNVTGGDVTIQANFAPTLSH